VVTTENSLKEGLVFHTPRVVRLTIV
jgi:hypothetical protein